MNKKIFSKLKMEKPDYYDCTKSEAVIIQKPEIEQIIRIVYKKGTRVGSILGTFGISVSSLLVLVTVPQFNSFLSIKGPTWEAIFILVFVSSFVVFLSSSFFIIWDLIKRGSWEPEIIRELFDKDKKV